MKRLLQPEALPADEIAREKRLFSAFCDHYDPDPQGWPVEIRRQYRKGIAHCRKAMVVAQLTGAAR